MDIDSLFSSTIDPAQPTQQYVSMLRNARLFGILAVLLITCVLIYVRFGAYLTFEQGMVIEPYGDGFKAYMSPAYHAMYDSSYSRFQGMHYPYGDHLVMSDPQPILTNTLKFLKPVEGMGLIQATIDWTHAVMLLSMLVSALFLYLIFTRLQLPVWFSVGIAVALSFMAPMVARMGYHFGLAQPAAIPVVLYFILRFQERPAWSWSIAIACSTIFFALFHFHYFGLFVLGISLYFAVDWLLVRSRAHLIQRVPHYAVQVLLPFVLLLYWMYGGTPVSDRASQPWGFLHYRARLEGLFTSLDQPWWNWVDRWVSPIATLDVEAQNYIGLVATTGVLLLLIIQLRSGFRCALLPPAIPGHSFLIRLFLSGFLLLLFALGIPFIIPSLEGLLRYLGPLQQFRALGRFSWFFFYAANIAGFAWLGYLLRAKKWALIPVLVLCGTEAYFYSAARDLNLDPVAGLQAPEALTQKALVKPDDFQALIPIPFFHLGSEQFWYEPKGSLQQEAMVLSMRTGLPMTSAMLSRTSLHQTLNQLQLVTEPYRLPLLLNDLPNTKPFLLLYDRREAAVQAPKWDHFKESLDTLGMQLLYTTADLNLYTLPLDFFEKNLQKRRAEVLAELQSPTLVQHDNYLSSDSTAGFLVQNWDQQPASKTYQGKGAFEARAKERTTFFDGQIPSTSSGTPLIISFWMFIRDDLRSRSIFSLHEYTPGTTELLQEQSSPIHPWVTVFDSNGWALVEFPFQPRQPTSRIQLAIQNKTLGKESLYLDALLIRPATLNLYQQNESYFYKNNRFYPRDTTLEHQ